MRYASYIIPATAIVVIGSGLACKPPKTQEQIQQETQAAFTEGAQAFKDGKARDTNPYVNDKENPHKAQGWFDGWDKAKADKEAKASAARARELEDRRMRELMAHDSENASQSRQIQEELARVAGAKASAARNKAIEAYIEKIRAKVKGNIVLPPGVSGDPFALFYVDQLPDGSVIEVRLKRSTGNAQLDGAIERAIQKSSPLPRPDKPELFNRTLELKFYPLRD